MLLGVCQASHARLDADHKALVHIMPASQLLQLRQHGTDNFTMFQAYRPSSPQTAGINKEQRLAGSTFIYQLAKCLAAKSCMQAARRTKPSKELPSNLQTQTSQQTTLHPLGVVQQMKQLHNEQHDTESLP
eukprot:GHRR01026075.1.p1 GENE.GHRR01026075.1~~GHRR01026075.1.p1  ORF type:complete len:131 (-),score=32.15 GHRR01026075.1:267-659(-)